MQTKDIFLRVAQGSIVLTLLSTITLWLTKTTPLKSQSAFANADNVIWYITIHTGMILAFLILNAIEGSKRFMYGVVAFFSGFTLMFNMYGYTTLHNISTAGIFLLASYCIIFYEQTRKRLYATTCITLGVTFLLTFIKVLPLSVYLVESIVEWIFGIIVIDRINKILKK